VISVPSALRLPVQTSTERHRDCMAVIFQKRILPLAGSKTSPGAFLGFGFQRCASRRGREAVGQSGERFPGRAQGWDGFRNPPLDGVPFISLRQAQSWPNAAGFSCRHVSQGCGSRQSPRSSVRPGPGTQPFDPLAQPRAGSCLPRRQH